jgi:DNA-binding transcriptional ArsR family regulator
MTNAERALDACADPTRRAILLSLRAGPQAVGALADPLPVSRSAVSQHLKVLAEAGLVRATAAGTRRLYRIDTDGFGELRAWFDQFWDDALDAFARHVEEDTR